MPDELIPYAIESVARIRAAFARLVGEQEGTLRDHYLKPSISKGMRQTPHLVSASEVLWKTSRRAVDRAFDAQLTHPVAEGVGVEIQDFCSTLWTVHHFSGLLKGGQDVTPLHFLQRGQS